MPCALEGGTEIVAENLFYNTPVRAKFMKTDKGEESEVSAVVARFILGNPDIAFRYYTDGKLSVQSLAADRKKLSPQFTARRRYRNVIVWTRQSTACASAAISVSRPIQRRIVPIKAPL